MSENSSIEWTDTTWNPVTGCTKVSPGCAHCYAETLAERFRGVPGHPFEQGFDLKLWPERLSLPLSWKKPRRIFVNSMSDLFHEAVPFEFIDRVFAVMALSPQHTFQLLTKRPERMREYLTKRDTAGAVAITIREVAPDGGLAAMQAMGTHVLRDVVQRRWPLPNVWLGTSTESQHWLDIRTNHLLNTPAAVHFLSCEPLLGPLSLPPYIPHIAGQGYRAARGVLRPDFPAAKLDWIVTGGESGPRARPCDLAWIRGIVEQCRAAEVACFVKQLGARPFTSDPGEQFGDRGLGRLKSRKGSDMGEWPEDLRVREMPVAAWNA